jgi:hypothetical protein
VALHCWPGAETLGCPAIKNGREFKLPLAFPVKMRDSLSILLAALFDPGWIRGCSVSVTLRTPHKEAATGRRTKPFPLLAIPVTTGPAPLDERSELARIHWPEATDDLLQSIVICSLAVFTILALLCVAHSVT